MKKESRGLDLPSFLLKPVQRICKYPLLIRELLKNTHEDHIDYKHVGEALKRISAVVDFINEKRRQVEQQQRLQSILLRLEFNDVIYFIKLYKYC